VDLDEYRSASLDQWERSARGWGARAPELQGRVAPISHWMVDAIRPQPGQTILELAAGPGETGFLAAELIQPAGKLISTDFAPAMVEQARARAAELGVDNVEFRHMDAESIDLDTGTIDGVLCRWGYMLMTDPETALRETRRVLRPLGRVALAAWSAPDANPWVTIAGEVVRDAANAPAPDPGGPGMFSFAPPGRVEELLSMTGFTDIEIEPMDMRFTFDSFEAWWEMSRDLGRPLADLFDALDQDAKERTIAALRARVSEYTVPDGGLDFPARPLLAAASA
jgi:SAM-dependent methyltransferase